MRKASLDVILEPVSGAICAMTLTATRTVVLGLVPKVIARCTVRSNWTVFLTSVCGVTAAVNLLVVCGGTWPSISGSRSEVS